MVVEPFGLYFGVRASEEWWGQVGREWSVAFQEREISITIIQNCRIQFGLDQWVLNLYCMLKSSGELFKIHMPRLHPQLIRSESLG